MRSFFISLQFGIVFGAVALTSCAIRPSTTAVTSALRGDSLAQADELLKYADRIKFDTNASAVCSLRAAEIAWGYLKTRGGSVKDVNALPEDQKHALRVLATATENLAPEFVGSNYAPEKTYSDRGYSYRVDAARVKQPGTYPLARLVGVEPAREVSRELCRNWYVEEGAGAPFAPDWDMPEDQELARFLSNERPYLEPITGVLTFDGPVKAGGTRGVSLIGYDPTYISKVHLGSTEYPLAADFTAPIVARTRDINEFKLSLDGLLNPNSREAKLILLEPYDPNRIPVLLVHGLNSHPRMWRDVINDLRADPKLRGRYQFMVFYYPTGAPIAYSALRLREELAALKEKVGPPKDMVMIGHSMGGLLSRMQVITPGKAIWNAQLRDDAAKFDRELPADHLLRRALVFNANPDISLEIYISTPHRGSRLADLSLTNMFVKLISLPTKITSTLIEIPGTIFQPTHLTSVKGLSPTNPLFSALDEVPIQVPHHSIIGDRGRGDTPNSSDGVVPYSSSHLESAASEVIVPDDHGAYDDPQAILEIRRILLLHAEVKETR